MSSAELSRRDSAMLHLTAMNVSETKNRKKIEHPNLQSACDHQTSLQSAMPLIAMLFCCKRAETHVARAHIVNHQLFPYRGIRLVAKFFRCSGYDLKVKFEKLEMRNQKGEMIHLCLSKRSPFGHVRHSSGKCAQNNSRFCGSQTSRIPEATILQEIPVGMLIARINAHSL